FVDNFPIRINSPDRDNPGRPAPCRRPPSLPQPGEEPMLASTSTRPASRLPLSVAIAAALALSVAVPAFAQEAGQEAPEAAQEAPAAPAGKTTELKTVIVTANKRLEDVLNVASSISVVGEEKMQSLGAGQLTDYAGYVLGLQVASNGTPGQTRVSLRGIAPLSSGATV